MVLFLQSTRVDWLVEETLRQQKDFAQTPAGDVDSHKLVCYWCAQARVPCDFTNRYFQRKEIDRIVLCRIPAEGIPEEGIGSGTILASRVPIYGTKDGFDSVHASKRGIKNHCSDVFQCGRLVVWPFPGKIRSHELFAATILGWQRTTRYFQILRNRVSRRRGLLYSCHGERQHWASTTNHLRRETCFDSKGYCKWNTSIEIRHTASCFDCKSNTPWLFLPHFEDTKALLKMLECNRIVQYAISTSTRGIKFSPVFSWNDAVVVTISDASFCQEQEQLDGSTQNFKSQQACITELAPSNVLNAEKDAYSLFELDFDENQNSMPHYLDGTSLRIVQCCWTWIANSSCHRWHERTARFPSMGGDGFCSKGHVWFTDCECLFAHLISPNTKQVDNKRLAIDLSALKQLIWDNRDDYNEKVSGSKGDYTRWIHTSAILSDCLKKTMTTCRLTETSRTSTFDMRPTEECLAIKAQNWKHWRQNKNWCKILILDTSPPHYYLSDRFRSCEAAEFKREYCS